MMLRAEARRRAGIELRDDETAQLNSWIDRLKEDGTVVHYDGDIDEGWFYVPRRPDIDMDLIREPAKRTGRPSRD